MTASYPPCVCCGSSEFKITPTLIPEFQLIHCQKCSSAFTWPQLSPEEIEKFYLQSYYGPENVKFISPLERIIHRITSQRANWLSGLIPPRSRILEIGCGRGLLLSALHQRGHECWGIERSDLAANRAKEISGLKILTAPLSGCDLSHSNFDLVILWHVLEHLHDPAGTLDILHHLLKPGGLVVMEVPNLSSLQSRISGHLWFHLDIERHLYHFTPAGLLGLMKNQGFQARIDGTYSSEQCPFGVLQSLLNLIVAPPEALYKILKKEMSFPLPAKISHLGLASILFIPAFLFALAEMGLRQGGVLRIIARKIES
jgi:SAM-dependent methyltransferase